MRLQPVIEARKQAGEWDIDAFGATQTDRMDTREIEEAIVVALDLSRSMEQNFNTSDDNSDDYSHKGITGKAARIILDQFFNRGNILQDALQPALSFLEKLDYFPNITRFIYHSSDPGHEWHGTSQDLLSRRQRAQDVIDELKIMYIHLHWRKSQAVSRFNDPILSRWESFIVIAAISTYKVHLVECLLKRAAEVKESAYTGVVPNVGIPFRRGVYGPCEG